MNAVRGDDGTERLCAPGRESCRSARIRGSARGFLGGFWETCELLEEVRELGTYEVVQDNELFSARRA